MHEYLKLTASALTINLDPLRPCKFCKEPLSKSAREESPEKKLEFGAAMKFNLLETLQGN